MSGKFGAFVVGGVVGAAFALLYAPRTGQETRALVADRANEAWGTAQRCGVEAQLRGQQIYGDMSAKGQAAYQAASANAQQAYTQASETAQDAINAAQSHMQDMRDNVKPVFTEKNDELREKIEAARQRIASQVAKNAEVAHEVMNEKIPVAADAAVDAVAQVHDAVDAAAQKLAGTHDPAPAPKPDDAFPKQDDKFAEQ